MRVDCTICGAILNYSSEENVLSSLRNKKDSNWFCEFCGEQNQNVKKDQVPKEETITYLY